MENQKIKFTPVNDGLGFHPFANGMPYAQTNSKNISPAPISFLPKTEAIVSPPKYVAAPVVQKKQQEIASPTDTLFYFLCDYAFSFSLFFLLVTIVAPYLEMEPFLVFRTEYLGFGIMFSALIHWGVSSVQELLFNKTVGMRVFGLALIGSPTRLFFRAIAGPFFLLTLGLGFVFGLDNRLAGIKLVRLDDEV